MKSIIIYGIGDFSNLMTTYFNNTYMFDIKAYFVDDEFFKESEFLNLLVYPTSKIIDFYPPSDVEVFIAVGYSNMRARKKIFNKIKSLGYNCVSFISPKANIDSTVKLGENNVVLDNVVIEPFCQIGDNNIIWSSTNICHNSKIFSHNFIASQCLLGGFSTLKNNCFLGFNSTIIDNIIIEDECIIAAKSLILNNTEKYSKYLGIPAKKVSEHEEKGIFIK